MMLVCEQREPSKQKTKHCASTKWAQSVGVDEFQLREVLQQAQCARRKLIEANLKLVVSVAKKYQKQNLELLDLIQEATLGLNHAVETFNPKNGYKFSTHAYWWIKQGIIRAIAQQSRTIRLPNNVIECN